MGETLFAKVGLAKLLTPRQSGRKSEKSSNVYLRQVCSFPLVLRPCLMVLSLLQRNVEDLAGLLTH